MKMENIEDGFKSGFVGIIGRPNVGKSTMMNAILGRKIAITSDKPQTTRNDILGIMNKDNMQVVFIDTPGIHKPKTLLGEFMVDKALRTPKNVDIIFYLVSCENALGKGEKFIMEHLKDIKKKVYLVINKMDLIPKEEALPIIQMYNELYDFAGIIPISAKKEENLGAILDIIEENLQEGPKFYLDDRMTTQPEKQIVSEIIREKILYLTDEEIPHSVAIVIEAIEEEKNLVRVYGSIFCERNSQKGIIIGKGGSMLKNIGKMARLELEKMWSMKVYLDLQVKVKENWRSKNIHLRNFGYEKNK